MTLSQTDNIELVAVFDDYDSLASSVEKCIQLAPDAVLIDANMNIAMVTDKLSKTIPATVLICLTMGGFRLEQIFLENGGRYFINKPLQFSEILATIRNSYQDFEVAREGFRLILSNTTIKIMTVAQNDEDHARMGEIVSSYPELELIGKFKQGYDLLSNLTTHKPDVVVIARYLTDIDDATLMKQILDIHPTCAFVNMSVADEMDWTLKIMKAGGRFFVAKPIIREDFYVTVLKSYIEYRKLHNLNE